MKAATLVVGGWFDAEDLSLGRSEIVSSVEEAQEGGFVLHSSAPALPDQTKNGGFGDLVKQGLTKSAETISPWILVLVLLPFACVGIFNVVTRVYRVVVEKKLPWFKKSRYEALKEEEMT